MGRTRGLIVVLACGVAMGLGPASASASSIDIPQSSTANWAPRFTHVGQTLTVPAMPATDNYFDTLTFSDLNWGAGGPASFKIYVTAATAGVPSVPPSGPFLYESAPISIPRSGPLTVHPNITVTPGTQYAVFFESSFTNLSTGIATGAYSGGDVVAYEAPNWSSIPPFDIALHADFTSTPPNPPPPTPVTPVTPASPATPAAPVTCPSLKRKLGRLQAKLAKQLTGVDDSAKKARKRAKIRKNIADTKKRMRKRRC